MTDVMDSRTGTSAYGWRPLEHNHSSMRIAYDPCCRPCPDCGGLECLCRPRFYPGQLLTEQDLNRLDHYIVEKNKLHNRYLVGAGVACGLEVLCDPCNETVLVTTGYAISPCGEDIIVCKPDRVDICALINKCREIEPPDCRPYATGDDACGEMIEEWILAIRYTEAPARPMPPGSPVTICSCGGKCHDCGGGCGCGGKTKSGSCGCGGSGSSTKPAVIREPVLRRGAPPACQPVVTCESYRYDVFRAPDPKPEDPQGSDDQGGFLQFAPLLKGLTGPLFERLRCCWQAVDLTLPPFPKSTSTTTPPQAKQANFRWICEWRDRLKRLLMRQPGHDCEMMERLAAVIPPDPQSSDAAFKAQSDQAALELFFVWFEMYIDCVCSALLPWCTDPGDPRIPLAVVRVRRRDCHIVSVCNWTPLRRQLVTFPSLAYWFSWLPLFKNLREFFDLMCCEKFGIVPPIRRMRAATMEGPPTHARTMEGAPPHAPSMATDGTTRVPPDGVETATTTLFTRKLHSDVTWPFAGKITEALLADRGLNTADLVGALTGAPPAGAASTRIDTTPHDATTAEAADVRTVQARLMAELLRPLAAAAPGLGAEWSLPMAAMRTDAPASVDAMRTELAELRTRVSRLEGTPQVARPLIE